MTATPEQIASIGHASRDLLRFAWLREPRSELLVTSSLIGVGRTFATDPQASAALLREAIAADHLKQHGYKELRWIAQEIIPIAEANPSLAVDIYQAAYGFAETSDESTPMGSSQILSLRSNRRQDYQGAWYQLSEAITRILCNDLEAGVRAVARSLLGYVQRERRYEHHSHEPSLDTFVVWGTANFEADWSSSWFRGGFQPNQDAPVLLKKFEDYLDRLATQDGAEAKFTRILTTLANEPHVVAAMWASLLIAGTKHAALYAHRLVPLASAFPLMLSSDTRFQLGNFLTAAFEYFRESDRETIERSILALPDNPIGNRAKVVLAGCVPRALISSAEMRTFVETLAQGGIATECSARAHHQFDAGIRHGCVSCIRRCSADGSGQRVAAPIDAAGRGSHGRQRRSGPFARFGQTAARRSQEASSGADEQILRQARGYAC